MKKLSFILIIVVVPFLLQSCFYDNSPTNVEPLPTNVSFSQDVQVIFDTRCVSCHNGDAASNSPDLSPGNAFNMLVNGNRDYVIPSDPDNSILVKAIRGGEDGISKMPPSGSLTDNQINTIVQWINEGAPNN